MLFATDGKHECFFTIDNSTLMDVLTDVEMSGVRVIAVAIGYRENISMSFPDKLYLNKKLWSFSDDGDHDLEALAEVSNGEVFLVPDGRIKHILQEHGKMWLLFVSIGQGPEGLRKVLLATSYYQSVESRHRRTQKVFELTKHHLSDPEMISFTIDTTIGQNAILRLWTNSTSLGTFLDSLTLTYPNQTISDLTIPSEQNNMAINLGSLPVRLNQAQNLYFSCLFSFFVYF